MLWDPKNLNKSFIQGLCILAEEALSLGMIDIVTSEDQFRKAVSEVAEDFVKRDLRAFASIKKLLKHDTLDRIESDESRSISEFVDIWYSDSTREQLARIEIRD